MQPRHICQLISSQLIEASRSFLHRPAKEAHEASLMQSTQQSQLVKPEALFDSNMS